MWHGVGEEGGSGLGRKKIISQENIQPPLCEWGMHLRKVLKQKRNFQKGKFKKHYVPSLYENIFEETESFSSCMDIHDGKLIFGSKNGSIILWIPNTTGGKDVLKKFLIR